MYVPLVFFGIHHTFLSMSPAIQCRQTTLDNVARSRPAGVMQAAPVSDVSNTSLSMFLAVPRGFAASILKDGHSVQDPCERTLTVPFLARCLQYDAVVWTSAV